MTSAPPRHSASSIDLLKGRVMSNFTPDGYGCRKDFAVKIAFVVAMCVSACVASKGDWPPPSSRPDADIVKMYVERFAADDVEHHTNAVPNAKAYSFMRDNVPIFECPDKEIERAYYFRWWTFRRHLKITPHGYVITEFLPDVGWAGAYNTINCAAGHHIMEGRWLRDRRYISDYSRFWFSEGTMSGPRAYVCWPAHAILSAVRVSGDMELAKLLLDSMARNWNLWAGGWKRKAYVDRCRYPDRPAVMFPMGQKGNGLFASTDDREGSENSLSGDGFRPLPSEAPP